MFKNFFITAWRNLLKNKTYASLNIMGLAIGVAVCLLIGVWLHRELSFDNFHPNDNEIFRISNTFKSESESFSQAPTGPAFSQLPRLLPAVKSSCRIFFNQFNTKISDRQYVESSVIEVSPNFFQFFGFKLKEGNPTQCLQAANRVVLSEKTAIKYFGSEDPIGKTILVNDQQSMVVSGVVENAPLNSQIQYDLIFSEKYLEERMMQQYKEDINTYWVGGWAFVYVRLQNPLQLEQTEKQINSIAAKYSEKDWKENKMSYYYFLQPIRDIHLKSHLRYDAGNNGNLAQVRVFSIVGIIVLLLACVNYINLTTAGAIKRAKETSVRKVIGASRWQLIRQFSIETFILCAISVCLGVLLFKLLLPAFSAWIGTDYRFPLNVTTVTILVCFIFLIGIIAGIYPAIVLSSFKPAVALKGNFSQSIRGTIIRKSLVVFQFTATIALIACIFIISQQMGFVKNKSLGFDGSAIVQIDFNRDQRVQDRYTAIRNEFLKDKTILNVSRHEQNIVGGVSNGWTTTENLKGEEISTSLYQMYADADYFNTYDMKLAAGRFFSKEIPTDTTKSVLVNEAAVRTFGWGKPENAIGKKFGKGDHTRYVIGVIKDFNFESLHKPVDALMIGYAKGSNLISLKIDASHIDEAINHLKKTWASIVPEVPLTYSFVEERINEQYGNEQKMEGIFYGFSALSLLIACLGLFGLTTFVVDRKVKEIGIRKVLGASVTGIVKLLSADFLMLVVISLLIATPLAWYFMHKWLEDFAYRIDIKWWVFLLSGIIAILITIITVSMRAIKAALANPVKSLRTE
ncbi:MAG: ABC transporter permease [Bacteroidetes bacterium]|nr:ABC transporter permease [Bacteroidota bacterium]